ncbi:MAG: MogA/MoaB family molybdenum cofactor biosynthesis protein [Candidatus Lokiarchaeota archaeon]|nr:MogA/MoaB family molybdenum cofactor biosynthesis protein [Candidatus Lokiarchaeota archaeon]
MITSDLPDTVKLHKEANPGHLRFCVAIVSTTRYNERRTALPSTDRTLGVVAPLLKENGHELARTEVVGDDESMIRALVKDFAANNDLDVLVTSGGTGISPRDITVDVLASMSLKQLPGFGELFRALSYKDVGASAMFSRAQAFIINLKPVFCLPGSPKAVKLGLERLIIPEVGHLLAMLRKKE